MPDRSRILTRIEPRGPQPLDEVLAARIGDPLWLLARQWQLGELLGEDAGTPVSASISLTTHPLTHVAAGAPTPGWPAQIGSDQLDPAVPLEAVVEATVSATVPLWRRADTGRALVELARDAGHHALASALAGQYPLQPPPIEDTAATEAWPLLQTLPDGELVYADVAGVDLSDPNSPLPPLFAATVPREQAVALLRDWLDWRAATSPAPPTVRSWDPAALSHRFTVAAASSEATTVFAGDYAGGGVDWYHFEVAEVAAPLPGAPDPVRRHIELVPSLVRFPGMPNERWWQVDDSVVDLGAVDAGAADLARLLVLDYAISYGGDAYLVPIALPAGSWTVVESLTVRDSFGETRSIGPAASREWAMFTVGGEDAPGLLLLPGAVSPVDGDVTDELTLARDELANVAWLIEEKWEGGTAGPVERRSPARPAAITAADPSVDVVWRLVDDPPPNWSPMLPDAEPSLGPVLRRLELSGRKPHTTLAGDVAQPLPDRAIPRQGRALTRRYRLAFDTHGRPVVWSGRQVGAATMSGASGIAWDRAVVPE